jgi:NAD(P)-dependent dehydrogenase (short-subunit alcohol dehydrogenase family)
MNIVITGASRGIGFELVGKYLDQGHRVFAISRNVKSLNEVYGSVEGFYALSFDLSSGDFHRLGDEIQKKFDEVDILINNAGLLVNKPFAEVSPSDLEKSYATNAFAPIYMVQTLSTIFNSNAHIINISSMGGFQGSLKFPGLMAYSSAKAALVCITECMQEEFKETNWAFNCLCLGAVQTEMLAEAFPGYEAPCSSKEMADYIFSFSLNNKGILKGKVLPVSSTNP